MAKIFINFDYKNHTTMFSVLHSTQLINHAVSKDFYSAFNEALTGAINNVKQLCRM